MDSLQHQIALTQLPQVGAITAKTLVRHCGSAEAVFKTSKKALRKIPGISHNAIDFMQAPEAMKLAEREMHFLESNDVNAMFFTDKDYPVRLQHCHDSPALLFYKGNDIQQLNTNKVISIVGTRQPTDYGKSLCEEIVECLKPYNVLIVSGLAYGIDITAHRKSCSIDLPNIGVLGHGLATVYPAQHRSIALKMIENGGLISEYLHDAKPDREHFPMRNRIIAGMCDALLVVETPASGGSMITATLAGRNEREIFAIPGRPHDAKSAGCNYLIRSHQAKLAECAEDIALAMGWDDDASSKPLQTQLLLDLDPIQSSLLELVRNNPEIHIDRLTKEFTIPAGELASHILALEFSGALRTLPGKRYVALG